MLFTIQTTYSYWIPATTNRQVYSYMKPREDSSKMFTSYILLEQDPREYFFLSEVYGYGKSYCEWDNRSQRGSRL